MIPLHPDDWAAVMGDDLADYIGGGGALVRFIVGDSPIDIGHARRSLQALAAESKLHFFDVDGSRTRLHFPNDLLAAIAGQIDFRELMISFLLQAVVDEGYDVPPNARDFVVRDIATMNDIVPKDVHAIINARIRSRIMQQRHLVRDVRKALWAIARDVMEGRPPGAHGDVPKRWLQGQISSIRELREFGIVQKVNRYNARGILRSILSWLPASEWNGSIVFVNALQLEAARNMRDGRVHYTRAALSDTYEVMREFIDDTDDMSHVLLVFAMPYEFLSVDPRGRGMGAYQALQFRVSSFSEATLPNPLANLVLLREREGRRAFSA
jgi:hypothetical protein